MARTPRTRTPRTARFRKNRYHVLFQNPGADCDGTCGAPKPGHKVIKIAPGLTGRRLLITLLHEGLHACLWDLDEEAVAETAHDLATWLDRLGYRRQQ